MSTSTTTYMHVQEDSKIEAARAITASRVSIESPRIDLTMFFDPDSDGVAKIDELIAELVVARDLLTAPEKISAEGIATQLAAWLGSRHEDRRRSAELSEDGTGVLVDTGDQADGLDHAAFLIKVEEA